MPHLIHEISGGAFANDPFTSRPRRACRRTGPSCWRSTATARSSGPAAAARRRGRRCRRAGWSRACRSPVPRRDAMAGGRVRRSPLREHRPLRGRRRGAGHHHGVGRGRALRGAAPTSAEARVAQLGRDGATTETTVPASGPGRGSAAKIAFTAANEGWMVTATGWVFHYTDGTAPPQPGPGVRGHDHVPAQRGGRAVHPGRASGRRLGALQAAAGRARAGPAARPDEASAGVAAEGPFEAARASPDRLVHLVAARTGAAAGAAQGPHGCAHEGAHAEGRAPPAGARAGRRHWPQRLSFRVKEPGGAAPGGDTPSTGDTVPTSGDTVATGGDTVATGVRRGGG